MNIIDFNSEKQKRKKVIKLSQILLEDQQIKDVVLKIKQICKEIKNDQNRKHDRLSTTFSRTKNNSESLE